MCVWEKREESASRISAAIPSAWGCWKRRRPKERTTLVMARNKGYDCTKEKTMLTMPVVVLRGADGADGHEGGDYGQRLAAGGWRMMHGRSAFRLLVVLMEGK